MEEELCNTMERLKAKERQNEMHYAIIKGMQIIITFIDQRIFS